MVVKMLVVAPTRELATQIEEVLSEAGKSSGLKVICLYGGASRKNQKDALMDGAHVIVATPGRLIDFLQDSVCDLGQVNFLVLDEADRMLDMGFEHDIRKIFSYLPTEGRQTAMFSATWPKAIQKLSEQFITDPVLVTIGTTEGKLVANENVTQIVEIVEDNSRYTKLITLLQKYHSSGKNKILVFVLYKKEAARLESWLNEEGWNCVAIHSDKKQNFRFQALESFKCGETPLLIATDVASRGLDIPHVEYVINYSFPLTVEDYVHRIGRTGRAGNKGIAHTFFQPDANKQHAGALVNVLRRTNQTIPEALLQFNLSVKKKEPTLGKINLEKPSATSTHITFSDSDSE
jgi:ATP-dependent RNA helicase DBP3